MEIVDGIPDPRGIEVPAWLGPVFFSRGRHILLSWVVEAGGFAVLSRRARASSLTLARWCGMADDGDVGWAYPGPWVGLDRVIGAIEEIDAGSSWLRSRAQASGGPAPLLADLRTGRPFGLVDLGLSRSRCMAAATRASVPRSTAARLWSSCRYPGSWYALDRIASLMGHAGWLEAVLSMTPPVSRALPRSALIGFCRMVAQSTPMSGSALASGVVSR